MKNRMSAVVAVWLAVSCPLACSNDNTSHNKYDAGDDTETTTASRGTDPWDERFDAFADALRADLDKSEAFGISAAVMEDGEITFRAAFGYKDGARTDPLTPKTLMQIGSTTKQMTAAALLRKVDEGLVGLDDSLEAALPELEFDRDSTWDDGISVFHLLTQQSGIVDFTPWGGTAADRALADFTYDTFDDEMYVMNPSGAFFNYANPNFVLAGVLTEQLDTRAFPDILTEDLFRPLGMDRTYIRKAEVLADGDFSLSFGYADNTAADTTQGPVSMDEMADSAWIRPAGLVWTTPTQMMTWARFIMAGDADILPEALREEMIAEHVNTYPGTEMSYYGFGLFVDRGFSADGAHWYRVPILQHGGNTLSFTHAFYMVPEQHFAVSICSSAYGDDLTQSVSAALTTLVDLPGSTAMPTPEVDPESFDRHVGYYVDPWIVGEMRVTHSGDRLLLEMPSLADEGISVDPELVPLTNEIFLALIDDDVYELTFIAEIDGGPSTYIRNRAMVAVRADDGAGGGMTGGSSRPVDFAARRTAPAPWDIRRFLIEGRAPASLSRPSL